MNTIKDLIAVMGENIDYKNFAEEVTIITETNSGANYSIYTVTNKNGVTFQNVPGTQKIKNVAHLGFINGDRGRPVIFGASSKVLNTTSTVSDPGWPVVNITSDSPDPLIIQPSDADSYLEELAPDTNYGTSTILQVSQPTSISKRIRSVLKVDFSALPGGATIISAPLSLYYFAWGGDGDPVGRTYWVYRLTQTLWTEGGVTWNKYDGTNNWSAAGGDYTTDDGASIVVPASFSWMNWDVKDQIIYARNNTSDIAHFLIRDGSESGSSSRKARFYSNNETVNLTLRPKLVINYE